MISVDDFIKSLEYFSNIKIVFGSKLVHQDQVGSYFGNKLIAIHRFNSNIPNNSYTQDLCFILHEYGHHKLKIPDSLYSKTGYIYFHNQSKIVLIKEEIYAWLIAFKTIFELPIKWYKKIYLFLFTFCQSWIAINSYERY